MFSENRVYLGLGPSPVEDYFAFELTFGLDLVVSTNFESDFELGVYF